MTDNFLTDREKQYLLDRAEFLKVSSLLSEVAGKIEQALAGAQTNQNKLYKSEIPNEQPGQQISVTFYLDNLTSDSLEEALPGIKKLLNEYHQLRVAHRMLEKRLHNKGRDIGLNVIAIDKQD